MEMLIISGMIGVIVGALGGSVTLYLMNKRKVSDLESDVYDSRIIRDALKEEIFRLSQQTKPKPRKRRGKA
tara:strand:+ start:117 stop:329 length:213 start_codon:yes stop_codon:yes gene_type:complete